MQRGALNEFQGQVEHSLLLASVIDGYDIRMVEYSGGAGFILKAAENVLQLSIPAGSLTSGILYDYLRLELDESAPPTEPGR